MVVMLSMTFAAEALPVTINFTALPTNDSVTPATPNNSPAQIAQLEAQLYVVATDTGSGVNFEFHNAVGLGSNVANIYLFDALGLLLSPPTITTTNDADFSAGASPGNLPGSWAYPVSQFFASDADNPKPGNGLNEAADTVTLGYTYGTGNDFADVEAALAVGNIRIGLHVISIDDYTDAQGVVHTGVSDSEWFESVPPDDPGQPVPEPASLALFGMGVAALALRRKRMK